MSPDNSRIRATSRAGTSRDYRADIDGLRAIALLAVMAYHAKLPFITGGYAGVDVFFVISGYLITGIIHREAAAGTFSFRRFYERRARRILPALFAVLGGCIVLALAVPDTEFTESFGSQLFASLFFAANLYLWRRPEGYFSVAEDYNPLVHLWSLGIEEQFYILFPIAILIVLKMKREWLPAILCAGFAISLGWCLYLGKAHQGANFYLLPSRSWELLAGSVLAATESGIRDRVRGHLFVGELLGAVGIALIVIPLFVIDPTTTYPGIATIPTILGTVLVIGFARAGTMSGSILAFRPMVLIGLISYSAYLWHQPLLAFARLLAFDHVGVGQSAVVLLVALAMGWLTWRFVETPFRHPRAGRARRFVVAAVAINTLLAVVATALWASGGFPQRFSPETRRLAGGLHAEYLDYHLGCFFLPGVPRAFHDGCRIGAKGPVSIAVLGDSHAMAIAPAFDDVLERRNEAGLLLIRSGCAPVISVPGMETSRAHCIEFYDQAIRFILAQPSIKTVIISARWTYDLQRLRFDNGEGGVEATLIEAPTPKAMQEIVLLGYAKAIRQLVAGNKRVILVYPIPETGWNVPISLAKMRTYGAHAAPLTTSFERFLDRNARVDTALDSLGRMPGLVRLYPARHLCGTGAAARCVVERGGVPFYFDDDHLTREGAIAALPEARDAALVFGPSRR